MNILHMKYAVEVAHVGSINKAAEELYIAPPNLSRSIKELEADLGIQLFERSPKGMILTPEGEQFVRYASNVLNQIDEIEKMYKGGTQTKQRFSISVPRASYISDAFARFTKSIENVPAEIFYMETNSSMVVNNILSSDYKLGIIRYASYYDKYFKDMLEEKGFSYEVVAEFRYNLLANKESVIAEKPNVTFADLQSMIEITHGDPYVPSLPLEEVRQAEMMGEINRRIFVFERGSQFELLAENPETFMWVSPVPTKLLERYGLVQRDFAWMSKVYKDVLIHRNDYVLNDLDKLFITELCESRRDYL